MLFREDVYLFNHYKIISNDNENYFTYCDKENNNYITLSIIVDGSQLKIILRDTEKGVFIVSDPLELSKPLPAYSLEDMQEEFQRAVSTCSKNNWFWFSVSPAGYCLNSTDKKRYEHTLKRVLISFYSYLYLYDSFGVGYSWDK